MQRVTAIALIPLTVWLTGSLVAIGAANHAQTVHWIRSPAVSIALLLTIAALFHHAQLGMQVIIEDYVQVEWKKIAALLAVKLIALAVASLVRPWPAVVAAVFVVAMLLAWMRQDKTSAPPSAA